MTDYPSAPQQEPTPPGAVHHYPYASYPPPKATNGLGIAGMVVGICTWAVGWVPFLGLAVGLVALGLSIGGMRKANAGKGTAIAGLVLGILATLWGLVYAITFSMAANETDNYLDCYDRADTPAERSACLD